MPMSTRSRLDFEDSSGPSKTVKHLVPVEIYLAAGIMDGEGREMNRLIVRPIGTPVSAFRYLMPKNAEGQMEVPAGWVFDAITKRLEEEQAPIPEEKVNVPMGDPMGKKGK